MKAKKHILIVDDDAILTASFCAILKTNFPHLEITVCKHGEEAIKELTSKKFSCIFVDLSMPIMNGWEFINKLTDFRNLITLPEIYIITSSISWQDKKWAKEHTLKLNYLEKPLTMSKIKHINFN